MSESLTLEKEVRDCLANKLLVPFQKLQRKYSVSLAHILRVINEMKHLKMDAVKLILFLCIFLTGCADNGSFAFTDSINENQREQYWHNRIAALGNELDVCTDPIRAKAIKKEMQKDAREL